MKNEVRYYYYHSNALLVINSRGLIRVVYTPFRVRCVDSVESIPKNAFVYVEEILSTENDKLHYLITGKPIAHHHFSILINF